MDGRFAIGRCSIPAAPLPFLMPVAFDEGNRKHLINESSLERRLASGGDPLF